MTLSRASAVPVAVKWATAKRSAKAGSDYVAAGGTVTFAAGQTSRGVTVQINGDKGKEPNQSFFVQLTNPSHATTAVARRIGVILNDD